MDEKQMQHGYDYEGEDPRGWFVSEKLWDCRAYWDGHQFWTRGGNIIPAPVAITATLPPCHLDGGFYAGRKGFTAARLAVQYGKWTPVVQFICFDAPQAAGDWPERIEAARALGVECVRWWTCQGEIGLLADLDRVVSVDAEGLVIRQPHTPYRGGRTRRILKLKADALMRLCQMP